MIKSSELINFQSHKYSLLEFSPGVNIVKGTSNSGKSSIVRALKWLIVNRPTGDSFKSHWAKKKDELSIGCELTNPDSDSFVSRKKDSKENAYTTEGETFSAIKFSIPEEIQTILRMNELNIQSQHDGYFLLQDTPGEVGKRLNEVAGLSIIDEVTKKITTLINRNKVILDKTKEELTLTKEILEELSFLDKAKPLIEEINGCIETGRELKAKSRLLETTYLAASEVEEELTDLKQFLKVEPLFSALNFTILSLEKISQERKNLDFILTDRIKCQEMIDENTEWLAVEGSQKELEAKIENLKKQHSIRVNLKSITSAIEKELERIHTEDMTLKSKTEEYEQTLLAAKICPLCGQPIKKGIMV